MTWWVWLARAGQSCNSPFLLDSVQSVSPAVLVTSGTDSEAQLVGTQSSGPPLQSGSVTPAPSSLKNSRCCSRGILVTHEQTAMPRVSKDAQPTLYVVQSLASSSHC